MSRAYRVTVKESTRRVIRAEDCVRTQLEVLDLLPREQMGELLAIELTQLGFIREGGQMIRDEGKVRTVIELSSGMVDLSAGEDHEFELERKKSGMIRDDRGQTIKQLEDSLKRQLAHDIDEGFERSQGELQQQITDKLESRLRDLQSELDQACNRATAAALKIKAAQMGHIKEMTEDPSTGSLTIVVEL
ncbi:MAG: hypothetical protein VYA84_04260 [Planctomycetota bacterium]|nr:hypothetical protein [Planctomycetota bacterium]